MRSTVFAAFGLAVTISATPALALERTAARLPFDSAGDWTAGLTCWVHYYNTCTGWVWVWSGWEGGSRLGVGTNSCANNPATLLQTQIMIGSGAPAGYGFTGTVAVHQADANWCPTGAALASQAWLPTGAFSYQVHNWSTAVPLRWVLLYTFGPAHDNPTTVLTDHPAAGPTGPQACGTCWDPSSRPNHSFAYGTAASPLCPGSTFNDGICDAALIVDEFIFDGPCCAAVESQSWGNIKSLYR